MTRIYQCWENNLNICFTFVIVHLIVHHPAHVFEVAIIEKCRTVKLHPHTQLLHAESADFWKYVTERVHEIWTLNSKAQTRSNAEFGSKETYRYLFRNIPLKRISIMLSISALFSCSFVRNSMGHMKQNLCTVVLYKVALFLPLWSSAVSSQAAVGFSVSLSLSSARRTASDCFRYWHAGSDWRRQEHSQTSVLIKGVKDTH